MAVRATTWARPIGTAMLLVRTLRTGTPLWSGLGRATMLRPVGTILGRQWWQRVLLRAELTPVRVTGVVFRLPLQL